jgi:hypothetical protein
MLRKSKLALFALPLFAATFVPHAFAATASLVKVPFEFSVGTVRMPAGRYRIEPQSRPSMVLLTNLDTGKQVQLARPLGSEANPTQLVFEPGSHNLVLTSVR